MLSAEAARILADALRSSTGREWREDELALLALYSSKMAALLEADRRGDFAAAAEFDEAVLLADMLRLTPRSRALLEEAQAFAPAFAHLPQAEALMALAGHDGRTH